VKIAVIGTGIGGLAAAWHLGTRHRVTVYERLPSLGMAAHGLDLGEGVEARRIDVPLRVLYAAYYPKLTALYREAGIETEPVDYSASFGRLGGSTYFRYRNLRIGGLSLPWVPGAQLLGADARRIVADLVRFYRGAARDLETGRLEKETIGEYLERRDYSEAFRERFVLPTFAGSGTCSYASVRRYPADVVVGYLTRGVLLEGVHRTVRGADHVVERLAGRVARVRCGVAVEALCPGPDGVVVGTADGSREHYDHVVLATPAPQGLAMLTRPTPAEVEALGAFRYERSRVLVHDDPGLAPARRADWSPVNFLLDEAADRPMATIWLNAVLPLPEGTGPLFQTWNPLREPEPGRVRVEAEFERPMVDRESAPAIDRIEALHAEPGRRVWLCGSYAKPGVPLLESAAASARAVAGCIDPET